MALKVIKPGTLILREKAQFKPEFEHEINCLKLGPTPCMSCLEKVYAAFNNMNSEDQDEYLKLWNRFETEKDQELEAEFMLCIPEIYFSNKGMGKIALKSRRFKHSCNANTIRYFDKEKDEYVVIATSKILCHEDIFMNYCAVTATEVDYDMLKDFPNVIWNYLTDNLISMKNLETRRKILLKEFGFECHCDICETEEVKGDNDCYEVYQNLKIEMKNLRQRVKLQPNNRELKELDKRGVRCYREMYKCAKECSADRLFIINDILIPGYECALSAHSFVTSCNKYDKLFQKDVENFAKCGLQLAKTIFEKNSSQWKDLEKYFKRVE